MNVLFDNGKMLYLISNIYVLTGIRAAVLDTEGQELCIYSEETDFCHLIQSTQEGRDRCKYCSRNSIQICEKREGADFHRCHAGLCKGIVPIQVGDRTEFYLLFGQYLDDSSRAEQWEEVLDRLDWYTGDRAALRTAFDALKQYAPQQIDAYMKILHALQSYIYTGSRNFSAQYTDQQQLEQYLDQHYTEKLSLTSISEALDIGRTKLCALARSMPGGYTISQMITQRRIREACTLLRRTNLPISEVSEAVGISDYNYFSKVFRLTTGMTPSAYRRSEIEENRRTIEKI